MSKLKKFLSKPRISRLVSFSVVLLLIAGSAYFAYKRGVFADIQVACKVQMKDGVTIQYDPIKNTDETGGSIVTGWSNLYLILNNQSTQSISNQNKYITVYGQGGSSYLYSEGSNKTSTVPQAQQPKIKSATFDCTGGKTIEVTYANTSREGTQGISINVITPQSAPASDTNLVCVRIKDDTGNPVRIDRSLLNSKPWDYTELPDSSCTSGQTGPGSDETTAAAATTLECENGETCVSVKGGDPYCVSNTEAEHQMYNKSTGCPRRTTGSAGSDAPAAPTKGCPTGEKCYDIAGDPDNSPVCLKPSDTGAVNVGMHTEVDINECTHQATATTDKCDKGQIWMVGKVSETGLCFPCGVITKNQAQKGETESYRFSTSDYTKNCSTPGGTIADAEGQGAGQIDPKVPVFGPGTQAAPAGTGKVTFSAWRNSGNGTEEDPAQNKIVPVGGVTLTLTGKPLKDANAKLEGLKAESGFANNKACSFWQSFQNTTMLRGIFGGQERYTIITPDNGLTNNTTIIRGLPAGTYTISARKSSFILPTPKNPTGDNNICFNVTKQSDTQVKVLLIAQPSAAEPPGIDAPVIYEKLNNNQSRFVSKGGEKGEYQFQYKPEAPYLGWQKIDSSLPNLGYNPERPNGLTAEGGLRPGISVGLGMPGGSIGGFINLCQGINLTIGTGNLSEVETIAFGLVMGAATGSKDNSLLKNAGIGGIIGWMASKAMGNNSSVSINFNPLREKCAAFNQLGIPPQCHICLSNPRLCPEGCWAYSAQFQMLSQMRDFF